MDQSGRGPERARTKEAAGEARILSRAMGGWWPQVAKQMSARAAERWRTPSAMSS
jgi:hypothetical protein